LSKPAAATAGAPSPPFATLSPPPRPRQPARDPRTSCGVSNYERLVYARGAGYRTAKISMIFMLLGEKNLRQSGVVEPRGIGCQACMRVTL
jgi:hypothetical protein